MRETLYLDTSVISAYYDQRDQSRQVLTIEFWSKIASYNVFISSLVLEEIQDTLDKNIQLKLLSLVSSFNKLGVSDEIVTIANKYIDGGIFPEKYRDDAYHLAIASFNNIDYLANWNFKHLVKVKTKRMANLVNLREGYQPIEIIAPAEL
jgi:predicted nucleic acid-binding protein